MQTTVVESRSILDGRSLNVLISSYRDRIVVVLTAERRANTVHHKTTQDDSSIHMSHDTLLAQTKRTNAVGHITVLTTYEYHHATIYFSNLANLTPVGYRE